MMDGLEARLGDLDARVAVIGREVDACVGELLVDDGGRLFVAERLPRLGSAIVPSVHRLIESMDVDEEVRSLAALAGVSVGDLGPSALVLLQVVEERGEFAPLAAAVLAAHDVPGTAATALRALRSCAADDIDVVVSLMRAIRDVGGHLPDDERQRLLGGPWQVASAVREYFPQGSVDGA